MESGEWKRLDGIVERLKGNYEGMLKGTQPMLKGAMRVAYAKALSDLVQTIINEQFDMVIPESATNTEVAT